MKPVAAIRNFGRGIGAVLALAFKAAPARTLGLLTNQTLLGSMTIVGGYATKALIQAATHHDQARAAAAGAVIALVAGVAVIASLITGQLTRRVSELFTTHLDGELIRLTTAIATLDYQDRPIYADKIALIRSSRQLLAASIQAVVINLQLAVIMVGTLVVLVGIDPVFVLLPLFAAPRFLADRRQQRLAKAALEASAEPQRLRTHLYNTAASPVAGKELRVFGLCEEMLRRHRAITETLRRMAREASQRAVFWSMTGSLAFTTGCVLAIGWVVLRGARGEVSLGNVVLAATLTTTVSTLMTTTLQMGQYLENTLQTVERYLWLVDFSAKSTDRASPSAKPPQRLQKGMTVEGLSFSYPDRDRPALSDITLDLPAGKVIALVGENGSGKSTLVKLLCGLYRPSQGRILIDGADLADMAAADWRARISAAFQDFTNFELPLHESVGVGDLARLGERDQALAAMAGAGAGDIAELSPEGLEVMLGRKWGGVELSGGQWQKLALARAIVRDQPLLVVFDEPAAALDATAEHDLFERFAAQARSRAASGQVTLLVSHRFSTVRMADLIAVLDKGRVIEFGSHETLLARAGLYAELFEMQARAYR